MEWLQDAEKFIVHKKVGRREVPVSGIGSVSGEAKVVLDASGTSNPLATLAGYASTGLCPHLTLDPAGRRVLQHIPFSQAAPVLPKGNIFSPHREGRAVWVKICKNAGTALGVEDSFWVGQMIRKIADAVGVSDFYDYAIPVAAWRYFSGICLASNIAAIPNDGPGKIDSNAFFEGLNEGRKPTMEPVLEEEPTPYEMEVMVSLAQREDSEPEPEKPKKKTSVLGYFKGDPIAYGDQGPMVDRLRKALDLPPGDYDSELLNEVIQLRDEAGLEPQSLIDKDAWKALDGVLKRRAAV